MTRGLGFVGILLAVSLLAVVPLPTGAQPGPCAVAFTQDDANSGRDAGDQSPAAVALTEERNYTAALSRPDASPIDTEDWFNATWDNQTRRVMVNVTSKITKLSYVLNNPLGTPHLNLEAYAPGNQTPSYEAERGPDDVLRLDFTTEEPGTWYFRIFLDTDQELSRCSGSDAAPDSSLLQNYNFYWGCHPHCVTVNT